MNTYCCLLVITIASLSAPSHAQPSPSPDPLSARADHLGTNAPAGYAADLVVVRDAQQQALAQARQMLAQGENASARAALETAILAMERAQAVLESAKQSPDKLPAAIAAEQAAYQALLKATPHEIRMSRSNNRGSGQGRSAGEPDQRQSDQLDLEKEQNRYETERQAQASPTAQQREQTQVADRLKELAQRQQDLNDRMRELQTSLQAARTDQERADLQNQLKRLEDEQRQMVASVDEMRQQLAQSPNASSEAGARQQLDQTRTDMQRASEELQNQSASQALAAGTRAQQNLQNLREDLRRQTSSQFSEQMRQLRSEARGLANRENEIARGLETLSNGGNHSLDDAAPREQISRQMARQESALTNLLAGMKEVTEQAETTEPLLSKQLYDNLRRADQMHTDNLLEMGSQLVEHGFLPQASEVERSTRTNITELADSVTRAADSVLGSQADALRYAQKELDDLSRQLAREVGGGTNAAEHGTSGLNGERDLSNHLARAEGRAAAENATGQTGTNATPGTNGVLPGGEAQLAANRPQGQQRGEGNNPAGDQSGNRGERSNGQGSNNRSASPGNPQAGPGQGETATDNHADQGERAGGNTPTPNGNSPNQPGGSRTSPAGEQAQNGGSNAQESGGAAGGAANADRLRQIAEQLGRGDQAAGNGGPITGNDYAAWSQQLRDVESVLDSPDLRNQLATLRDRVGAFRAAYRNGRRIPSAETVREQLLMPLAQVQVWVREELARQENSGSLVPLDRDPVPEHYSELVRQYYEKLGSAQ